MTSETEETDDDESEPNNANVNNYLHCANMATNLESTMKLAEEEDLWIGESGSLSHMMGSEEHVFNKKLISGSVRTANGADMKILCDGDINVDVITKTGNVTSGTLKVKVIPGMNQKFFRFTQAMLGGWTMQGGQTKQRELFIAPSHEGQKPIIFIEFEGWQLSLVSSKDGDQESRKGQCSDCEWKLIKRILPQSNRTCWTSFDV